MSSSKLRENQKLLENGYNLSDLKCVFTIDEIKNKIKELYDMDEKEVNYHAYHIENNDYLKICDDEEELEDVIRWQIDSQENLYYQTSD